LTKKKQYGFKLGSVLDPNISEIEKDDQEDPNQLFSLRQANDQQIPERERSESVNCSKEPRPALLNVQTSLTKKQISSLNNINKPPGAVRRVSFA